MIAILQLGKESLTFFARFQSPILFLAFLLLFLMFEKKPATINSSGISWWRGGGRFIHFSILCIINIEILPSKQYIFETREGGYFSKLMGNIDSKILTDLYSHVGQAQNTSEDARMLVLDRTFWVSSETGEIFNVFGPLGLATRFWDPTSVTDISNWTQEWWVICLKLSLSWNQFQAFWQKLWQT